jgi:NAD(P)-dependent dehydrogenase (short-subunit alcohol dehydrogenase family)
MIDSQLENKVVPISGANHGIGAATAKAFAAQGSKVFITYSGTSPGNRQKSCKGQRRPEPAAMFIAALCSKSRGMKS